jgi:fluoride exporter
VACTQLFGPVFPWATLTVNVVGSFLMGLVVGFSGLLLGGSSVLRTFLATGILGGFTTFSAFSLDVVQLVERRQHALAALYISASVVISIAALWAGLTAARVSLR